MNLIELNTALRTRRKKEWGRVEATEPNHIWQSDMTKHPVVAPRLRPPSGKRLLFHDVHQ